MVLINGKLYTVANGIIESGFLEITGNKITSLGPMSDFAGKGETYDMKGFSVFPGFLDIHCHVGMWEDGLGFEGDDGNEDTDPLSPQLRAVDAVNPMDRCFAEARRAGVTCVVTGPGSASPVSGQSAALKTIGKRVEDCLLKAPVAIKFALGENPKGTYHAKGETPVTRMATAALIREQLAKARRYQEDLRKAEEDEDCDEPEYDIKCQALLPLLDGTLTAHFHAHRADDIFTAIRIAKEFNLSYVIVHGTEGHTIADILAKENVRLIAGPILCDRSKPELRELTPASPGILCSAGVKTAICTDHPVTPIQYLPLCAGLAVKEGMSFDMALRAITLTAAEIAGIADRVGSLEVGKDADIAVFAGDPFSVYAKPQMVLIDGQFVR